MIAGWRKLLRRWHPEGIPWPGSMLYNTLSRSRIFTQHYQLVAEDLTNYCRSGRVLDIGTGPGSLLLALHRTLPDVKATGVDISAAMVSVARKNLAQTGRDGLSEVTQAAADALPLREPQEAHQTNGSSGRRNPEELRTKIGGKEAP